MKLPIQYALEYPAPAARAWPSGWIGESAGGWSSSRRIRSGSRRWRLGYEVARAGGTSGAVLNAANEAAVEAFLGG